MDLEFFKKQCKQYNLRITPQRILIYKVVLSSPEHPNTEIVFRQVKEEFSNISFNTVHRTLLTFAELKLLDTVEGFGGPKRFDPNLSNHHHLHCEKCGKIVDFKDKTYDDLPAPRQLDNDFEITRTRVVISGICKDCQKKIKY